ncbi:MAG: elongator complex protein 3, partial [Acidobacteriota bacterium]
MKSITWSTPYRFSPAEHEQELSAIIREIETVEELDRSTLDRILRKYPKGGKGFFSKSEIIQGYRHLRGEWKSPDPFIERVRMKPVRTLSGVAPVTVLTQPYPCPGECIFCPNDVRMPKSYLSREPGAQRAAHHQFDPYRQTFSRLRALRQMGHGIDKVELIILGGTWSSYPESYQLWFLRRCFEAMNDFGNGEGGLAGDSVPPRIDFRKLASQGNGRFTTNPYNQVVADFLKSEGWDRWAEDRQSATWEELARAQRENEHGTVRNVGLSVETRPDHLSEEEVGMIRRQGATKVQIGYQSLSDDVLRLNRRGHDVAATRRAMRLLRHAGFKIQAHWMPNLYGSSPQEDIEDFDRIFSEPDFRPD